MLPGDADEKWAIAANRHLWAYLMARFQKAKRYHPDSKMVTVEGSHSCEFYGLRKTSHLQVEPGPEGTARTQILVAAKNRWAQTMREEEAGGTGVPVETQRASWDAYMAQAEEQIDARIEFDKFRESAA